jgi:hypothetical protein
MHTLLSETMKRLLGRPRRQWKESAKIDNKKRGIAMDRNQCEGLAIMQINLLIPLNGWNFFKSRTTLSL